MSGLWTTSRLFDSTYRDLGSPEQVGRRFLMHLLNSSSCLESILQILSADPGKTGVHDFSLELDAHEFILSDPLLGNMILLHPAALLPLLEDAIVESQRQVCSRLRLTRHLGEKFRSFLPFPPDEPFIKGEKNTRVHARLVHLPPHPTCCKPSISALTCADVGKIIQISGTVVRASKVQMYESQRAFKCYDKKCGLRFIRKADLEQYNNALDAPTSCPNPECQGLKIEAIPEGTVRSDYQEIKVQESMSQKTLSSQAGIIPKALLIKLQHDLVDRCLPGDDVVIVGSLISHWQSNLVGMSDCNISMAINAHSIRVVNGNGGSGSSWDRIFIDSGQLPHSVGIEKKENVTAIKQNECSIVRDEIMNAYTKFWAQNKSQEFPIATRNFICQAVCPTLYGMSAVKLALLLTLIGGSGTDVNSEYNASVLKKPRNQAKGSFYEDYEGPKQFSFSCNDTFSINKKKGSNEMTKDESLKDRRIQESVKICRREQSHLLLVGDPGTGKSQFLRFAAALCPRSVLTSGTGTTSAGLTAAAVREGQDFILEAGALVLADRGVCAIDEFSCISEKDRTTIHEAMEQQTLSVAKAGIVCKLNCRATVVAVTNPRGGIYDHDKSFVDNVGIGGALLSRFDLIFKLIDTSDPVKDENVATFLLNRAIKGSDYDCSKKCGSDDAAYWSMDKLRAYIATVKGRYHPTLNEEAGTLLKKHYEECRKSDQMSLSITVRFLESLIRLAQAHARLMFRNIVILDDAVSIILLMESSVLTRTSESFDENCLYKDPLNTIFFTDERADYYFLIEKEKILKKYGMNEYFSFARPSEISHYSRNEEFRRCELEEELNFGSFRSFSNNHTVHTQNSFEDHYGRTQHSQTKKHRK